MNFTIKLMWAENGYWKATLSETAWVLGVGKTTQEAVQDLFSKATQLRADFTADMENGALREHLVSELDTLNELLG